MSPQDEAAVCPQQGDFLRHPGTLARSDSISCSTSGCPPTGLAATTAVRLTIQNGAAWPGRAGFAVSSVVCRSPRADGFHAVACGRALHSSRKSYVAFKYLLDRTADLYTIDNEGRNLLHMTIQNGCFFMVLCLIDAKFDRTLINTSNQWNVFHYIASSESSYNNRALQLFKYFMLLGDTERYDTQDVFGNSVYETAIINDNFDIAREMVETKLTNSSTPERIVFLLDTVERLVELDKLGSVTEYFKYLFEYGDNVWKEVYDTIYNRIPIV